VKLSEIPFLRSEKAKEIYDAAKQSTASLYGASAELIVSELAKEIKASQACEAKLEKMLTQVFDELPGGNHQKILTIDGVGKLTAAAVVAATVSLERFATPEALVNFFGVFPEHESSGTDKHGNPLPPGPAHMSRKGNDLVRKMLYMSALNGIGSNPLLRAHYAKLRANGKQGSVALGHCMKKILQRYNE
jgi:transposase